MNSNKLNIQVIFIGKPQWEAGWPYIGFDNNTLIDSIRLHLKNKFPKVDFIFNTIITSYNHQLVSEIKNNIKDGAGFTYKINSEPRN